jgi:hypothetical protein
VKRIWFFGLKSATFFAESLPITFDLDTDFGFS